MKENSELDKNCFNSNWLRPGAVVPVDIPTTGALLAEIQRLQARLHMWAVEMNIAGVKDGADNPRHAIQRLRDSALGVSSLARGETATNMGTDPHVAPLLATSVAERNEIIEECAKACEGYQTVIVPFMPAAIAKSIRALKGDTSPAASGRSEFDRFDPATGSPAPSVKAHSFKDWAHEAHKNWGGLDSRERALTHDAWIASGVAATLKATSFASSAIAPNEISSKEILSNSFDTPPTMKRSDWRWLLRDARPLLLRAWEKSGEGAFGPIATALSNIDSVLSGTPALRSAIAITERERVVIGNLIHTADAIYHALDDSEELEDKSISVPEEHYNLLSLAIACLDDLPDDKPGYIMCPAAKAKWALRRIIGESEPESEQVVDIGKQNV